MKLTFIKVPIKTVLTGVQYGTSSIKHFPQNIKIVGMKDLSDGKVLTNNLFLGDIPKNTIKQFKLKKGDILLNRTNSYELVGKVGIYDSDETAVFASYLVRLNVIKEKIDSYFLNYFLNLSSTQKEIRKIVTRAIGQANINPSQFIRHCMIPDIPLPEQKKIAKILGTWDLAIEKLTALIEQKKLLKKGLMQRLLNFKKEYLKRFDEIFEDYSDKKHSDKDLLSATQENGVIPRRLLKGRVMSPEGSLDGYKLVQSGSFVISLRSFQGGLEYSDYEGIISPAYTVLKDKISINKCFYRYFFKSYNFIEKYLSIAVIGIRDGKQISYPDLQSVKIPYPPLSEQKAIADILSKADEEIDLLTAKLSALKSQKKGLMQKLLTGQIRVKVA